MDIGFETIGNATLIAHDNTPVIATDPWIQGSAYFGSWGLPYEIPREQFQAVLDCPYLFFSHGHPDHLNAECLPLFQGKKILLADHYGGRIKNDLEKQGFEVHVLPDRKWFRLTDRIQVLSIADLGQDSVLLLDINGRLVVNTNDCGDHGWGAFVRNIARRYKRSFLLCLASFGDTDMFNFYDESGTFIEPEPIKGRRLGADIAAAAHRLRVTDFIPFSSLHKYQRADSIWANKYSASLDDMKVGFTSNHCQMLPPFIQVDCGNDTHACINPKKVPEMVFEPSHFGDDWSSTLDSKELTRATQYFRKIDHLKTHLGFIELRIGGKSHAIPMGAANPNRGITFEAPKNSFMSCIDYRIFDGILVGNFMKVTLHGDWPVTRLYPDFTPYVCKYADNANAFTHAEVAAYFKAYEKRSLGVKLHRLDRRSRELFTRVFPRYSRTFLSARKVYRAIRGRAA